MEKNIIVDKLAAYIKKEISNQNVSVKDLALRSQMSEDYWRKIMRSEIKAPSYSTIENIAKGLNISKRKLLEELNEIDILHNHLLTQNESNEFIQAIKPYLNRCEIKANSLSESERFEIANYLMLTIKMISNKF